MHEIVFEIFAGYYHGLFDSFYPYGIMFEIGKINKIVIFSFNKTNRIGV